MPDNKIIREKNQYLIYYNLAIWETKHVEFKSTLLVNYKFYVALFSNEEL